MGVPMYMHACRLESITGCLSLALASIYFETLTEPAATVSNGPQDYRYSLLLSALTWVLGSELRTSCFAQQALYTLSHLPSQVLQPETNEQQIKYKNLIINLIFNHQSKCK